MRKLLLIPLFLLSCCMNSPKTETKKYGEGLTQEELFDQAAELKGISVIKIGDTYETIKRNLTEHNKQFRSFYDEWGSKKDSYPDLPIDFKFLNIYDSYKDDDYNKSHYDQRKSVDLIITKDFVIDLALFFCNDTLYQIEVENQEDKLVKLFEEKYGEGSGYDTDKIIGKRPKLKSVDRYIVRRWENEAVVAKYWKSFYHNFENSKDFRNNLSLSFTIESKTIDRKTIDDGNNEIKEKIKSEETEQKNNLLDML